MGQAQLLQAAGAWSEDMVGVSTQDGRGVGGLCA